MPNIRVSDYIYEKLKEYADAEHRSVANATEFLLVRGLENQGSPSELTPLPKNVSVSELVKSPVSIEKKIVGGKPLSMGEALKAIELRKAELKDDLEFCQDAETRRRLERDAQGDLDELWAEYHTAKAVEAV